jgi:pimeloyl-ACP methyl ester carboxylesterase
VNAHGPSLADVPTTTTTGITLDYEVLGDPSHDAVLLVSGLGAQRISWADGFCALLVDAGYRVIRFDNRDSGWSTVLDGVAVDLGALLGAVHAGDLATARALVPYTLGDLAADAVAVLDACGVERAHVVGASMGGMIAQQMAIEHPHRLATLTSMMSTTGEPEYGASAPEAQAVLMAPAPRDRAAFIEASPNTKVWCSKRYADDDQIRRDAAAAYDRAFNPEGTGRQFAAIVASGPRADGLRALRVPTLVLHGLDDTLITPSGGIRTAELIDGATLHLIPDMGHDRPEPLWGTLVDAMVAHFGTADR